MKTLIFDFDGTLADSFELAMDIVYELTGIPRQSPEQIAHLKRLPVLKAARELHIPLRMAPRFMIKGRQLMQARMAEVHAFPGIPETLRTLHEHGYHLLVISSNSEQNVRIFLRANKLESYFDGVYGNASIFNKALTLRRVLRRNRLDAKECFYIGDEVRDIVAARKAGLTPMAVTWGYQATDTLAEQQPHALIDHPTDLVHAFVSVGDKIA